MIADDWLISAFGVVLATVWVLRSRNYVEIRLLGLFRITFGDQPPNSTAPKQ